MAFMPGGPSKLTWRQLATTTFTEYYDNTKGIWSMEASYPPTLTSLRGQEIYITGYVLPVDTKGEIYALSAYPFSSCFFCGGAGPESVMGLEFKETPGRLATDAVKTYIGTLVLVQKPSNGFYFTLINVRPYTP
ncbi:MAG TPA: DUF3299 domain-containing protein [Cryomorphaceae bacterium]|jgi:hypothetical protein|nr:MAG: hypothetical protein ABR98_01055 [Cryomorphaceae bacterium BACL7 MAG-120910-bin2]KRO69287.1 MAG: hypothetical protein ABR88_04515 [Cryomorphaceae bacterium BACL7 MAG-120322-bin74]KRO82360.1 MAG: hypothetical protein ABR87_02685 [Cryomorphaceae bacterium BACL7 MAG-121220-bin83]HAB31280.1 DUF3299 domain-containing protein [Cryomorphaceae bacterium]HAG49384.1 DUF3299 domain-containing protein [Cryomorphaceae bacterium]